MPKRPQEAAKKKKKKTKQTVLDPPNPSVGLALVWGGLRGPPKLSNGSKNQNAGRPPPPGRPTVLAARQENISYSPTGVLGKD